MGADPEATYYVSTEGNDAWSGRLSEPNSKGTDGPFATLIRARDAVRRAKADRGGLKEAVTVMVRAGTYFLDETFVLDARDSGTPECPISWCSYPGETAILSGGKTIRDWRRHDGRVLRAAVPDAGGRRFKDHARDDQEGGTWKFVVLARPDWS